MVSGQAPVPPGGGHDGETTGEVKHVQRHPSTVVGGIFDAEPGKRRRMWPLVVGMWLVTLVVAAFLGGHVGFDQGVAHNKSEIAAAAEAQKKKEAERKPPEGLYCPETGSAEYLGPKTLRDQPVVTISVTIIASIVWLEGAHSCNVVFLTTIVSSSLLAP